MATVILIPDIWRKILNRKRGCWTTLYALSDWLQEQDLLLESEVLNWAAVKRRAPVNPGRQWGSAWAWADRERGRVSAASLPSTLYQTVQWLGPKADTFDAYCRLIKGWGFGSERERGLWWNWNPATNSYEIIGTIPSTSLSGGGDGLGGGNESYCGILW